MSRTSPPRDVPKRARPSASLHSWLSDDEEEDGASRRDAPTTLDMSDEEQEPGSAAFKKRLVPQEDRGTSPIVFSRIGTSFRRSSMSHRHSVVQSWMDSYSKSLLAFSEASMVSRGSIPVLSWAPVQDSATVRTTRPRRDTVLSHRSHEDIAEDLLEAEEAPFLEHVASYGTLDEEDTHPTRLSHGDMGGMSSGSSVAQAIFNTVNLLVGIGFLSLPFALRAGGWVAGIGMVIVLGFIARFTGGLLGECIRMYPHLRNFADMGEAVFGRSGRFIIGSIFIAELFCTCVVFIILISDSLHAIFPDIHIAYFRLAAFVSCAAFSCLKSLKLLSYMSLLGVLASFNLVVVVLVNGFVKTSAPGSILDPASTYLWPAHYLSPSFTFGIIMAGFAGHAVLPSIYLDMRDKSKYAFVLNISFVVACGFYLAIGAAGYLMFGDATLEEVTKNLADASATSLPLLNTITTWLIAFIPLPKYALTMAAVAGAADAWVSHHFVPRASQSRQRKRQPTTLLPPPPAWMQMVVRILLTALTAAVPFFVPHFDVVLSLVGCIFSVLVSILLPLLFHVRLSRASLWASVPHYSLMTICGLLGVVATLGTLLPSARPQSPPGN